MTLGDQVKFACRRLLSEINRDPESSAFGCFDRRYWAWKLADFPEATYQRNLANLAWFMETNLPDDKRKWMGDVIVAGLLFTASVQHPDGSFDQAYPFERSFGATGFLLPDLISAYSSVIPLLSGEQKKRIEKCLSRAANFLVDHAEGHALISNHLAGAALGLIKASQILRCEQYRNRAMSILQLILSNQSPEGWFPEYGGADPGYQTLCVHYLAQIQEIAPSSELHGALVKAVDFLKYFIQPDGTFGGEYGSRRTEIFYPGGLALLANENPTACVMTAFMRKCMENLRTVTLVDIDMGNIAPLLSSCILSLIADSHRKTEKLPIQEHIIKKSFPDAGIVIWSNPVYYAVLSIKNGGVLKIFDKSAKNLVYDDCGALADTKRGVSITTQSTCQEIKFEIKEHSVSFQSDFFVMTQQKPTPINYLILRVLNLTLMRIPFFNEVVKKVMVNWLIRTDRQVPLTRFRDVEFLEKKIKIKDHFSRKSRLRLTKLAQGGKFNAIHMASSRYFSESQAKENSFEILDHEALNRKGELDVFRTISFIKNKSEGEA